MLWYGFCRCVCNVTWFAVAVIEIVQSTELLALSCFAFQRGGCVFNLKNIKSDFIVDKLLTLNQNPEQIVSKNRVDELSCR